MDSSSRTLSLEKDDARLRIRFGSQLLIDHSPERPCLFLGIGEGRYKSWHGHYKIREKRPKHMQFSDLSVEDEGEDRIALRCGAETDAPLLVIRRIEKDSEKETGRSSGERDNRSSEEVEINVEDAPERVNRMWLRLAAEGDEHIYGCGELYSALDLRGRRVPLWVQEQGVGRGSDLISRFTELHSHTSGAWYSTYYPQTSFVSSSGWYCIADTRAYAEFDFLSASHHTLYFWDVPHVRVGVTESFADATAALNKIHGLQPELPDWSYDGIWLGVQGGGEEIERKLTQATDAGIEVGGLWVQDWEGRRVTAFGKQLMWNWKYDEDKYPGLPSQIEDLKSRGIRFLGYINPFLAIEEDLYKEASEKGYCVQHPEGGDYLVTVTTFPAALIDLTNPEAFEWIKGVIKEHMIGIGMDGWMCDYGEYLPTDAALHSGESAEEFHNRYPVEWARANREAVEEAGAVDRVVFFVRAGHNYSSRYAMANWAGDQLVNWSLNDGLATAITAGLNMSFSGGANYHSDVGGFTSLAWVKRSKELLLRWVEYAAFNPIMRSHESNRPDDCVQFNEDEETLSQFARMTKVFRALKPYHKALSEEYRRSGITPIRHPALRYGGDEELHRYRFQYLYGDDLFVAPVYEKGQKRRRLYLPDDRWIHLWSGKEFGGGVCKVSAPIGKPPVFYRKESPWAELFSSLRRVAESR